MTYIPECVWHNGDFIRYWYGIVQEDGTVGLYDAQLLLSNVNMSDCKTFCDDPSDP